MPDRRTDIPPVPQTTARAALAVLGRGNPYVMVGDRLGQLTRAAGWGDWPGATDECGEQSLVLALITVFQYVERLPDRRAAEAVRRRIEWKYALHMPIDHPGLDHRNLVQFRHRLRRRSVELDAFERLVAVLEELMSVEASGQPASGGDVVAVVDRFSELEQASEAMSAVVEVLATRKPDWLLEISPPHWYERYGRPESTGRELPGSLEELAVLITAMKRDILYMLGELDRAGLGSGELGPEVQALRRVGIELVQAEPAGSPRGRT